MADTEIRFRRLPLAAIVCAVLGVANIHSVSAATLTVTDCGDDNNPGTLRRVVLDAPDNSGIQIPLMCSKITLSEGVRIPSTITNINIVGQSPSQTVIDAGNGIGFTIYSAERTGSNTGL
jgi:hypothetical protein